MLGFALIGVTVVALLIGLGLIQAFPPLWSLARPSRL